MPAVIRLALAGAALAAVAACTSSLSAVPGASASARTSPVAPPSGSVSSAAPSPTAMASWSGASTSSTIDACALLAKSDVTTVIGAVSEAPAETSAPMTGVGARASVCAYRGATGLLTLALLTQAMDRSAFDNVMRQVPGVQPIDGIGDAAYGTAVGTNGANGASVLVLKGTTYFTIVATSSSSDGAAMLGSLKTLATKVATKI